MSGATPKDGPSAGISICTAYLSLLLNKSIPANLAMTGELSLTGEVHKIGGVHSKVSASRSVGIERIILPYQNLGEFMELPTLLRENLTAYFVKEYREVYEIVFEEKTQLENTLVFRQGKLFDPKRERIGPKYISHDSSMRQEIVNN